MAVFDTCRNHFSMAMVLSFLATLGSALESHWANIIVNTTGDVADFGGAQQVADLPGPDGLISLREAIIAANNTTGPDTIGFNIPVIDPGFDGTVLTIRPIFFTLPALADDGTTIDGSTQVAFTGNTNPPGPEIVLDGSLVADVPGSEDGFDIHSSNNHIHSLVIHSFVFDGDGIRMGTAGSGGNRVTGCFIGADHTGMIAKPNGQNGVDIGNGPLNNVVGGTAPREGNLISGNANSGVNIFNASQNFVLGNLIGTDVTGQNPLPNQNNGVSLHGGAMLNVIGGMSPAARSVLSGNAVNGIQLGGAVRTGTSCKGISSEPMCQAPSRSATRLAGSISAVAHVSI